MKIDKSLYWSIKITIFILGVITIYKTIPYLNEQLELFVFAIKNMKTTYERLAILSGISILLTCKVIDTIVNIAYKLQHLITRSDVKERCEELKEELKNG